MSQPSSCSAPVFVGGPCENGPQYADLRPGVLGVSRYRNVIRHRSSRETTMTTDESSQGEVRFTAARGNAAVPDWYPELLDTVAGRIQTGRQRACVNGFLTPGDSRRETSSTCGHSQLHGRTSKLCKRRLHNCRGTTTSRCWRSSAPLTCDSGMRRRLLKRAGAVMSWSITSMKGSTNALGRRSPARRRQPDDRSAAVQNEEQRGRRVRLARFRRTHRHRRVGDRDHRESAAAD